jgi:simple sugar transport system substrate-binding protein
MQKFMAATTIACLCFAIACGERAANQNDDGAARTAIRIVAVTHGQSADPFWSVVANGIKDAAKDLEVRVEYQAPTSFDMVRMSQLIDAAAASRPAGMLVSIPDPDALRGAISKARASGIPIISINSGADAWQQLQLLAHIGQTEYEAGRAGGESLVRAGARKVLCINHEVGNMALDERCRGLRDAVQSAGGATTVLAVNLADPDDAQQRIVNALQQDVLNGILTLGPAGAAPTLAALRATNKLGKVQFGTFDLSGDVLQALQNGAMLFAIDQQPYLQGYLGVTLLVKFLETGAIAGGQQVIRTGPGFVTRENAARVTQMIERGVR